MLATVVNVLQTPLIKQCMYKLGI